MTTIGVNHLHAYKVFVDDEGCVQLWLGDGGRAMKVWLDKEHARELLRDLMKAINSAQDVEE